MKDENAKRPQPDHKVHITAIYTITAADVHFVVEQDLTVKQVIDEAYKKLEETGRPGDQYFCHTEPRVDLAPYLNLTLRALKEKGICVHEEHGNKLIFEFDIDAEPGGAA